MHAIDAPLGLCNVLTVLGGLACVWIAAPVRRSGFVCAPALAAPAVFGVVVAVTLLAGVFEATPGHDAEWAGALVLGAIIGRARGWSLRVEISLPGGLVRLRSRWDEVCFAGGVAATAIVDFLNAALGTPVIHPAHVAAAAAFCAGFLGCRALAVLARLARREQNAA